MDELDEALYELPNSVYINLFSLHVDQFVWYTAFIKELPYDA